VKQASRKQVINDLSPGRKKNLKRRELQEARAHSPALRAAQQEFSYPPSSQVQRALRYSGATLPREGATQPDFSQMMQDAAAYNKVITEALQEPVAFFDALTRFGPRFLAAEPILIRVETWWQTKETDPTARENLQAIGTALAQIGKGRTPEVTSELARRIQSTYEEERSFCQQFRKTSNKPWRTSRERNQALARQFNMPLEQAARAVEEGTTLTPSQWARQRTAKKTGFSEETVRQILLNRSSAKRV